MTLRQARLGTRRRERVVPWAAVAVALAVAGLALTVWRPTAPPTPPVSTDLATFDAAVTAAVEAYRAPRYLVSAAATALSLLVPLAVALTRRGRGWVRRWAGLAAHSPVRAVGVAVLVSMITSATILPLAWWARVVHDGAWGFRTQSAASWLGDWLLRSAGAWLLVGVLAALLAVAMQRWPRSWPFRLTVLGTLFAGVLVLLHPVVFQPLLTPTAPLPDDAPHRDAIAEVMAAAGDPDVPLYVGEASRRTTRVNALVTGFGPTRRIVLHDTLLTLPEERVASVVAHEIAHHQHEDLGRAVLLGAAALLPALLLLKVVLGTAGVQRLAAARGPSDPRLFAVAVALAAILELAGQPVANGVSRELEAAADARAVAITGDPGDAVRLARTFTVRDLASPQPPRAVRLLWGTHPTVRERIHQAVALADDGMPTRDELEREEAAITHPSALETDP